MSVTADSLSLAKGLLTAVAPHRMAPHPRSAVRCSAEECNRATRHGKPYCPRHVHLHDYARDVLDALARMEEECALILRRGARAVDLDGLLVREICTAIRRQGSVSVALLARDLSLDRRVVHHCVVALTRCGALEMAPGRRSRDSARVQPHPSLSSVARAG